MSEFLIQEHPNGNVKDQSDKGGRADITSVGFFFFSLLNTNEKNISLNFTFYKNVSCQITKKRLRIYCFPIFFPTTTKKLCVKIY